MTIDLDKKLNDNFPLKYILSYEFFYSDNQNRILVLYDTSPNWACIDAFSIKFINILFELYLIFTLGNFNFYVLLTVLFIVFLVANSIKKLPKTIITFFYVWALMQKPDFYHKSA